MNEIKFNSQKSKLKRFGSDLFEPEQVRRYESYVESKYPMFHFRKRRKYAKEVLKYANKQLIQSHIYQGAKVWDSSPTLVKRLIKALKNLVEYSKENISGLKRSAQSKKLKLENWIAENVNAVVGQAPVIIGVSASHGGKRTIKGVFAKAFHLMNRLLNILGLSLRLNPSGIPLAVKRLKGKEQQLQGNSLICGNPLGHWYRKEKEVIVYPYDRIDPIHFTNTIGGIHLMCEMEQTEEGVLL